MTKPFIIPATTIDGGTMVLIHNNDIRPAIGKHVEYVCTTDPTGVPSPSHHEFSHFIYMMLIKLFSSSEMNSHDSSAVFCHNILNPVDEVRDLSEDFP